MTITGDQSLLREINRMALVRVVQRQPGLSRADLAKETGLTKSTVSLLVQDLIDEGWMVESDVQATGAAGRRPTPLCIDGSRLALIGADVSLDNLSVLAVSLTGEVISEVAEPLAGGRPEIVIRQLARLVGNLVERARKGGRRLLGIGVGVPGAVLTRQGVVKLAPNLAWRDVAFRSELSIELASLGVEDLPIFVQNDFDVAALGEYEFGEAPVPDPLIYLGLGVGVGAGVVVRDRLFLGADGFAGEVGHSILQLEGPVCSCGRRGCAEAFIGLRAISTRISGHAEDMLSVETIRRLLDREDEGALLSVKRAGRYLGVLIQNLWMYFNPGRVVIGGPVCELGAPFLDAARTCLEAYAQDCALQLPDIRLARFGTRSIAIGAAALVRHVLLRPMEFRFHEL
ncbi:MAG: ROK family transcriptional regulator [Propionivibrio sp.]